jgi:hypothetical protein
MFTAAGGLLAVAGLAATMAIGSAAFADTTPTTANAEVASTITLTGDAAFTLTGSPGDATATTSALNAETNNEAGYNVTVLADTANLVPGDTVANTDVIPVSSLEVLNTSAAYTGLSTTVPVTVHTQAARSIAGGDALTASYQLTMPFVNADTYSGGLTFTAAAN